MMNKTETIWIVYDEECIFCRNYCALVRIRKAVGHVELINARNKLPIMDEINSLNLDIDQGMVVKYKGKIYYGYEAIHILSLLSTRSDIFNRFTSRLFYSKSASRIIYPLLRECRNFALWLMNISKIDNLKETN